MTRVLIVDDKSENLYYLKALLTGHGCEVESARHGAEALVLARQAAPELVISDLLMPVMDGYTLLRHWKSDRRLKHVPFIVYTATYTEAEDEQLALSLGADAFILKPAEPEDFLARLRQVQANAAAGVAAWPKQPAGDEDMLLKDYSHTLIRKLEEKTLQLEEANQALQHDLIRREAVEAALRRSEEEFRLLTEAMPQIVWMSRPDGWFTHVNQKWSEFTGRPLIEGIGDGWSAALHPDDRQRAADGWRQATASGRAPDIEFRLTRADGTHHWMLGRALPLVGATGHIVRWFGTWTDIEELKNAQARMAEQASLLDKSRDVILVRALDNRILYLNRRAEQLVGLSAAAATNRSVLELFRPERSAFEAAMQQVLAEGEWTGELQQSTGADVALTMDCRWTLVRGEGGQPDSILAIETDVTERKLLEEQFRRAQRLESIGTLAGGIAHDLNNALSPIVLSIEMLKNASDDAERQDLLSIMDGCARRASDMIRQVLSFARGVEGRRVEVQVGPLILEVAKIANDTFLKAIEVRTSIDAMLQSVVGDPTQVHRVLLNLCVNARDAMPAGGVLSLVATNVTVNAHTASLTPGAAAGPYVRVVVEDTGIGMSRAVLDRLFEPFFTTKEIGLGTGLGLSTSLAIVKSHRGFIDVESEPGRGTRFSVYLPAQSTGSASRPESEPPAGS